MNILGLHALGHDTGAAVVSDRLGRLEIVSMTEARLVRVNHASTYPLLAIQYCLDALGLKIDDVDCVYADDLWEVDRARNHGEQFPERLSERWLVDAHCDYFEYLRQFGRILEQSVRFTPKFINHLDAHAASAYYLSPFESAAVLCMDAGTGIYHGTGLSLRKIDRIGYTGDLYHDGELIEKAFATTSPENTIPNTAYMYDAVTELLGYTPFECGKTMAVAAYGHLFPRRDVVQFSRGRFVDFIIHHGAAIDRMRSELPAFPSNSRTDPMTRIAEPWVNLAREAQEALEEDIVYLSKLAHAKTGSTHLCLAGGTALSCVGNRRVYDTGLYQDIFIVPAASDEGIAVGCALHGYYENGGSRRRILGHAYLGRSNDPSEAGLLLQDVGLAYAKATLEDVALLLAHGNTVGRIAGASEWGPRALGNRSILASPQFAEMKDRLNVRVKHRENFRPFAPSCHADKRGRYFDLPVEGPFMILAAPVRDDAKGLIPAVTHVDGSSRPQTIRRDQNPPYYDLIDAFGEITGCYVIVNTSFNDKDEPIVEDYLDALVSFARTEMDYLFIEDQYLVAAPRDRETLLASLTARQSARIARAYERAVAEMCDVVIYERFRASSEKVYCLPPKSLVYGDR